MRAYPPFRTVGRSGYASITQILPRRAGQASAAAGYSNADQALTVLKLQQHKVLYRYLNVKR